MKPDPLVTCPFDEAHRIHASAISRHLEICKENHPSSGMVRCPFDACHFVKEIYYEQHISNCASSGNVRNYKYSIEPVQEVGTVPLENLKDLSVPITEDWDEEDVETYDPCKGTENRPVIRCLIVAPKSRKKQFKLAERRRFRKLFRRDFIECEIVTSCDRLLKLKLDSVLDSNIDSKLIEKLSKLRIQNPDLSVEDIKFCKLRISSPGRILKHRSFLEMENVLRKKFEGLTIHCLGRHIHTSKKNPSTETIKLE